MAEVVVIDDEDEVPSQQRPISRYDSDSYLEVIDVCSEGGSEDASASGPQGTAGTGMDSAPAPPAPIAVANPAPEAHEHTGASLPSACSTSLLLDSSNQQEYQVLLWEKP
jgi:hypothetical protein